MDHSLRIGTLETYGPDEDRLLLAGALHKYGARRVIV